MSGASIPPSCPRHRAAFWRALCWASVERWAKRWRSSWWRATSRACPKGIFEGVRTLTGNIVIEMGYAAGLHREALIATGVVLFIFILLINLSFSALKRRKKA